MKTRNLFFLLVTACLMAVGCTKEYITQQYITQGMDMTLIDFTVKNSNWQIRDVDYGNDDEGYFQAVLEVPEITKEVVNQGIVLVSRRYTDNNETIWTPLPSLFTEKTEDSLYYTTTVDYEWKQGYVYIFVTASDLYAGASPGDMSFRVAIQL